MDETGKVTGMAGEATAPGVPKAPVTVGAPEAGDASGAPGSPEAPEAQAAGACEGTEACTCLCRHKDTPRDEALQRDLQRRLNRVIGQLNGVKSMIDDNRYCGDVLTQLSAAESAVHSISAILLQNHLETCVVEQIEQGNVEVIDEAMQLIKKFAR